MSKYLTKSNEIARLREHFDALIHGKFLATSLGGVLNSLGSPADFGKLLADESMWAKVIEFANIKTE